MRYVLGIILLAVLGLMLFIRLAPTDPAQWHTALGAVEDADGAGSAMRVLKADASVLARADAYMRSLPRTKAIAGSVEDRHITYVTRSLVFGFPDYTTLQYSEAEGLFKAFARLRFGKSDFGVNRERLDGLFAALQ
ncbi:MAG: DUF1499 domain-containing protein [Roseobacter sp.]